MSPIHASLHRATHQLGLKPPVSPRAQFGLAAAVVAVAMEAGHFLFGVFDTIWIGRVPVSPSTLPALAAATVAGASLAGRPRSPASGRSFWALAAVSVLAGTVALAHASPASILGLFVAGFNEELLYRLAVPALVAFALNAAGVRFGPARLIGYAAGGVAFVFLPGHVAQWQSWVDVTPFAAFALVAAIAVYRSGALFEVAVLHGLMNVVNVGRLHGTVGSAGAWMLCGVSLLLLVAYVPRRRVVPEVEEIIDLTVYEDQPVLPAAARS